MQRPDYWREYRRKNQEKLRAYYARPGVKKRKSEHLKAWIQNNKDRRAASQKKSYLKNREKRIAANRAFYAKNKDRISAQNRQYYWKNRTQKRAYNKRYHIRRYNTDSEYRSKILSQSKRWAQANPEKCKESVRKYFRLHPEVSKAMCQKRRALKKGASIDLTGVLEFIKKIRTATEIECFYCLQLVPKGKRHVDHKTPLSRGGKHAIDNLCCACEHCNCVKSDKTESEFRSTLRTETKP